MARRETDDSAGALDIHQPEQFRIAFRGGGNIGEQGGKVIGKNKSVFVGWVLGVIGAGVSRTQVTLGIVSGTFFRGNTLNLTLPGSLGAVRRNKNPLTSEWIVTAMRMVKRIEGHQISS
jgi:hypothetical protein